MFSPFFLSLPLLLSYFIQFLPSPTLLLLVPPILIPSSSLLRSHQLSFIYSCLSSSLLSLLLFVSCYPFVSGRKVPGEGRLA